MIKRIEAVELYCDTCGQPYTDEYFGVSFHRTADDIRASASEEWDGWRVDSDENAIPGTDKCSNCRDKESEESGQPYNVNWTEARTGTGRNV